MNRLSLQVTCPAPRAVWHEISQTDPLALVQQTPDWVEAICATGGYVDASRLYETSDGQQMILPMVRTQGLSRALSFEASFPAAWGYGGLLARQPLRPEHINLIFTELQARASLRTSIRPNPLNGVVWAAGWRPGVVKLPRVAHVLDLTGGFETVWAKRFDGKTRNQIRKAERAGLVVECDTTGRLLPVFYQLLEHSFERWGQQHHEPRALARWRGHQRDPLTKFQAIAAALGEGCRVWVAWHEGRPAASILVLQGANAHYTRGAMDKELAGPTVANDLLHHLAIQEACRAGCRAYHMGESGTSTALAHFKRRFGAAPHPYAEYRVEKLPFTTLDQRLRGAVKRMIGFKDA
jgi:CelD/BcsL family acetyltransferase involved in cellulose biosynthesis